MSTTFGLKNETSLNIGSMGIVTDSLRLYYDAGIKSSYPGSGATWYDISGNNTHCTLYGSGGATYTDNYATEPKLLNFKQPPSFYFDGVDDFGKFTQFTFTTNQSVSVWIKTTTTKTTAGLLSNCNGGPVYNAFSIAGGYPVYKYYSTAWNTWTGSTLINDGTWKNIVWAKAGTAMNLYIDGTLSQSTTLLASVTGAMSSIGSEWGPCNPDSYGAGTSSYGSVFAGNIGAIMAHTKQLSATEVLQNYNVLKNRYKS